VLTFGILYILAIFFPRLYISLNCKAASIFDADYFLIIAEENTSFIRKVIKENFFKKNSLITTDLPKVSKENIAQCIFGDEIDNRDEKSIILYFRHNKYIFIESENCLSTVKFDLVKFKNREIHSYFGKGLKDISSYNYMLNKFGPNEIAMKSKSFCRIFLEQLLYPLYLYQIYVQVIWNKEGYYSFAIITLICSLIILLINTHHTHKNYNKIMSFNNNTPATVRRDFVI
jgi:hypothetical protein